jgi:hypothetical protein
MYLCPPVANERKGSLRVMYRAKADFMVEYGEAFVLAAPVVSALFFCKSSFVTDFVTDVAKALEIFYFVIFVLNKCT